MRLVIEDVTQFITTKARRMLVLSRKPSQAVVLSNGTTFKVLRIDRGRVQVGILAPQGVRILRSECLEHEEGIEKEK